MNLAPLNSSDGMRLSWRSWGVHYDPCQTQRVVGAHVYIARTLPDRIDMWRLELPDKIPAGDPWNPARMTDDPDGRGYRWTLVHRWPRHQ